MQTSRHIVHGRIAFAMILIVLFAVLIVARLVMLQIIDRTWYQTLAQEQHEVLQKLWPERGTIISYNREHTSAPFAINTKKFLVYADPHILSLTPEEKNTLATLLQLTPPALQEKIADTEKRYVILQKDVAPDTVIAIKEQHWKGIGSSEIAARMYPEKSSGAHVVGYVGESQDGVRGRYGLEEYFEDLLRGNQGFLKQEQDNKGRPLMLGDTHLQKAEGGATIVTTLDRSIEFFACNALNKAVTKHGAEGGSVVIIEPTSGKIMAMCSNPIFDPNRYQDITDLATFNNQVIFGAWEPGSIFKALTMASAIDAGRITPHTRYIDEGFIKMHEFTIRNADNKVYGSQDMTQVLENSINTGAVFAAEKLGNAAFKTYVEKFGMGQKTGIELPGESEGNIASLKKRGNIYTATASFGQGITATPLQMVMAYGAIANGGMLMKPYVVEEIRIPDAESPEYPLGNEIITSKPQRIRRVITEPSARVVRGMLRNVVEQGHGKRARVAGYTVGGKTGTSQVAHKNEKGYEEGNYIGSFIGFAPVEHPRFVMAVRIDRPKDVIYAESTAAPLFGEIAKFLLEYLEVPQDKKF